MQTYLAFDIGNSTTKVGLFEGEHLRSIWRFPTTDLTRNDGSWMAELPKTKDIFIGWINVSSELELDQLPIWREWERVPTFIHIDHRYPFPIRNAYQTPETLGTDRVVGIIGARTQFPDAPLLVIDIGTAITYDCLSEHNVFLGGGISPGMSMRFKALHTFTAQLPEVDEKGNISLIGNTTIDSIRSGVVNGIAAEINGIIQGYYREIGDRLRLILTGGDMDFFEKRINYPNFAEGNLVLLGLHTLLLNHT